MTKADSERMLQRLVEDASDIVVLTGAGMSTNSGIPDFRSDDGVWADSDLVRAMSDTYLRRFPEEFWPRYKQVFMRPEYLKAVPNTGHRALAQWEQQNKRITIFTQNVDGLHQLAGNSSVFEMHGSARTAECPVCREVYGLEHILSEEVPTCCWINVKGAECGTALRPDTVLFGQSVRHLDHAVEAVQHCDLFLVLGTSLTVDPVAELPNYAYRANVPIAVVNFDRTYIDSVATIVLHENIGDVLSRISM